MCNSQSKQRYPVSEIFQKRQITCFLEVVTSESLDLEDTGMENWVEFITTRFIDPHSIESITVFYCFHVHTVILPIYVSYYNKCIHKFGKKF